MKKILIALVTVVLLFFAFVYFYIPGQIEFKATKYAVVSPSAAVRVLSKEVNWHKWWPQQNEKHQADSIFQYENSSFIINRQLYNAFKIDIIKGEDSIHSLLNLVPTGFDSTQLHWNAVMISSLNPFKRLSKYWRVTETERQMEFILSSLAKFLEAQENIYGMQIRREIVQDTLLVFKEELSEVYPSTASVYGIVTKLRGEIKKAGASETNVPMLNVIEVEPGKYRVMVAIPVNREFALTDDSISFRRMVQGWILVSEIKGGPSVIKKAKSEMSNYVNDYSKIPIALPFESMVTNRLLETDTSNWKTRLYFPVVL
jgi:hypothetical protein